MKDMTAPALAGLAVLYALIALLSAGPTSSGSALVKSQEGVSDLGSLLIQTVMLQQRQHQAKDHTETAKRGSDNESAAGVESQRFLFRTGRWRHEKSDAGSDPFVSAIETAQADRND